MIYVMDQKQIFFWFSKTIKYSIKIYLYNNIPWQISNNSCINSYNLIQITCVYHQKQSLWKNFKSRLKSENLYVGKISKKTFWENQKRRDKPCKIAYNFVWANKKV